MATTLTECQTLVDSISALFAQYVYEESRAAKFATMEYNSTVVADAGTSTLNQVDANGAIQTLAVNNQTALTPSIAVARANASTRYLKAILRPLAKTVADQLDLLVLSLYSGFSTHAPVGAAGVALTEANYLLAVNTIAGNAPFAADIAMVMKSSVSTAFPTIMQAAPLIDAAKGQGVALGAILKARPTKFRGALLSHTPQVVTTGSAPATQNNLCFSRPAIASLTVAQTLTNDGSNVQAMSTYNDAEGQAILGIFVGLAYDGSDNQTVTFRARAAAKMNNAAWGHQVKA